MLRDGPGASSVKARLESSAFFVPAQQAEDQFGIGVFTLRRDGAEDFFDDTQLFRFVVNDEILFVAEQMDVLAQNARAERMKRADRRAFRFAFVLPRFCGVARAWRRVLFISRAALLVKVTAKMFPGAIPWLIKCAMRQVITRVLPVPAPARISTGP